MKNDFKRRIKEASLNAWPALNQIFLDGWILRFSAGYTKRANSVNPLYPAYYNFETKIKICESIYKKNNLPVIFRLTSFSDRTNLDEELARRKYKYLDKTSVMILNLQNFSDDSISRLIMKEETLEKWMDIITNISRKQGDKNQAIHQEILTRILSEPVFTSLVDTEKYVSCSLGVIEDGLLGIFDLVTDVAHRRKGYGEQLMKKLLMKGKERGAHYAYLQVMYANKAAMQLYKKLGFKELYYYWYRIKE